MLPDYLPPEKIAVTNDPSELRNLLESSFAVTYLHASLRDITLLSGAIIAVRGNTFPATQFFLEDLADFIKMPAAYTHEIGFALFQHNFLELKGIKDQAVQVCVVAGRAVGLVKGEYRPARLLDVLNALPSGDEGFWKIQKSSLSDRSAEIDLLSEDFVLEPVPCDTIRAGIRISNSETGGYGLKASLYTLRLACSNGAVMHTSLGTVRWGNDKRMTYASSITKFSNDLTHLQNRQLQLRDVYSNAVQRPLLEEDVTRLWRRIRTAGNFTPEHTDHVLGITNEDRHRLASIVAERRATHQPAQESSWDLFTIHNRVTAAARTSQFAVRSRLEQIGGEILSLYTLN